MNLFKKQAPVYTGIRNEELYNRDMDILKEVLKRVIDKQEKLSELIHIFVAVLDFYPYGETWNCYAKFIKKYDLGDILQKYDF